MKKSTGDEALFTLIGFITGVLLVLRIFKYITWSWFWVFIPLWGSLAIAIIILFFAWIVGAFGSQRRIDIEKINDIYKEELKKQTKIKNT